MPVSPHGLFFAGVQLVVVLSSWALFLRWPQRGASTPRPFVWLASALVVEYGLLRIQPIRMGGDPFEYTLGLFDGVTVVGLLGLVLLEWLRRNRH